MALCTENISPMIRQQCQIPLSASTFRSASGSKRLKDVDRMQKLTMGKNDNLTRAGERSQDTTRLTIHDRQVEENVKNIEPPSESLSAYRWLQPGTSHKVTAPVPQYTVDRWLQARRRKFRYCDPVGLVDNITLKAVAHAVIKDAFEPTWLSTVEEGLYTGVYLQLVEKGLDFGADPTHALGQAAPGLRFLEEAYLQGLMTVPNATEEIYAVLLFGYARKLLDPPHAPGHNHWRLFAPLYDFGDLQSLIYAHMYKAQAIPEPFIWHTLICLMKAAVQLEQQAQLRPGERTPSDVIVVFDMKPANILLGRPNRTFTFPIYPRPHIADLGVGCLTNQQDPANLSDQMKFTHTPGYLAPEMSRCLPQEVLRGTCTNVWQIGRVLEVMMKLIPDDFEDMDYRFRPGTVPADLEPRIVNYNYWLPAQRYYSDTLKQTVAACLRLNPADRPSPQNFLGSVDNLKPLFRGLDTFGNDAWFANRQRNRAAMPQRPEPRTTAEVTDLRAAEAEKQRRIAKAWPYLRVWGPDRAAEYADLGVFPPEHDEVLYDGEANWWATDPADFIWQSGLPVYPPVVVPPTVNLPAVGPSSSAGIL